MTDTKREIKFRAWDTDNEIWLNYIKFSCSGEMLTAGDYKMIPIQNPERVVILQFTGLLDKNGKEIYEGDIVLVCFNDGSLYDHPQHVYFEKGSFCVGMGYLSDSKIIEVIGNIYESKHLIDNTDTKV